MKLKNEKYNAGAIGKAARNSVFIASSAMLNTLGCRLVGHELCTVCHCALEIWQTANKRYMPLTRENGMEWNAQDRILYRLHWHATPQEVTELEIKREREAWQAARQAYKNHLRLAAGINAEEEEEAAR